MDGAVKLGRLIRDSRVESGLSQKELAEGAGLSLGAVRDLEQGRSSHPRARSLDAIAEVLQLGPDDRARLRQHAARPAREQPEPAGPVRIGVLGPLGVRRDEGPAVGFGRHRVVLARLALTPNHPVSRDELIDVVWGGDAPASAANVLQTHVSRLRRILDPEMLGRTPGGYRLNATEDQLDLVAYRARLADWRRVSGTDPQRAFDLLSQALDMWRGAQAAEDVTELHGHPLVAGLADELIDATIELARLGQSLRRLPEVLPRLRRLTARHHWHEALHARLVIALAAAGQQAAALEAYEQVKSRLADELGIDPGAELIAARQAVLEGKWETSTAPPPRAPTPWQAPAPPPDFTGRAEQLARLERLLRGARRRPADAPQVTCVVSGMPGVGKTSLALRAAQAVRDDFPDGQLYIDLRGADRRPVGEAEALARLLRGLGVPGRGIPAEAGEASALYRSVLAERRILVILDNARNAAQVRPLLPGPGAGAVLVTSRHHCADLAGAALVDLPVLSTGEAVAMLSARGAPDDPDAVSALAEACGRLPVALRVIASRLGGRQRRSAREVLARLTETRAGADGDDAAVTATFDLSYRELPPGPAWAFRWAALVPGPTFSADAVAALLADETGTTERSLDALVDENMLEAVEPGRYRFHDLLRRYAGERLATHTTDDRSVALGRLADWYTARTAAAIRLVYPKFVRLPTELDTAPMCFDDLTAAWSWLDDEIGALVALVEQLSAGDHRTRSWQLADQLRGYFFVRREAVAWLTTGHAGMRAAEAAGDRNAQAAMHQTIGQAYWSIGRHQAALEAYRKGVAAARDGGWPIGAAYLLHNLGLVHAELGLVDEARQLYLTALDAGTGPEFTHVRAVTLNDLGVLCSEQGRLSEAVQHLRAAMEANRGAARLPSAIANCSNLGMALRQLGDYDGAYECYDRALTHYREAGEVSGQMAVLDELSQLYQQRGEWHVAVGAATEAMRIAEELANQRAQAGVLNTLGSALLGARAVTAALERFRSALEISRACGYRYFEAQAGIGVAEALLTGGAADEAQAAAKDALVIAEQADYRILAGNAQALIQRTQRAYPASISR
ncbi:tetratricopeptide repeat protein [Actinoplanes sp. NPDC026670]|uniref:tetratricopeptide repeat protein n=1 Tax=Actinoplanes sp. NPDC026670 TaxID=3154700 RepID=UPI0033C84525